MSLRTKFAYVHLLMIIGIFVFRLGLCFQLIFVGNVLFADEGEKQSSGHKKEEKTNSWQR